MRRGYYLSTIPAHVAIMAALVRAYAGALRQWEVDGRWAQSEYGGAGILREAAGDLAAAVDALANHLMTAWGAPPERSVAELVREFHRKHEHFLGELRLAIRITARSCRYSRRSAGPA